MLIQKYSIGIGDRFGHQGVAQLKALKMLKERGVLAVPVWNKSRREHNLIGSSPIDARIEADKAVAALGWTDSYYVDADHIGLKTVGDFTEYCNFFTIDVADFIGLAPKDEEVKQYVVSASKYIGTLRIPRVSVTFEITEEKLYEIARKYLVAIKEAGAIYRHILESKTEGTFVTEVSLDENLEPQTPVELFFILLGLSLEGVPVQTIAPKFSGRFNKGVDYVGDLQVFTREFEDDLAVLKFAVGEFNLPASLKLSVHSGSDKFSLYRPIHDAIKKFDAGLHLKTAGTTWLEEVIGLSEAEGEGLEIAKDIYAKAFERMDELTKPYATVVDIDKSLLPTPTQVNNWRNGQFAGALRHNQKNPEYNLHFRQLVHVSFKLAAEMGEKYTDALVKYADIVGKNVTENIFERHLKPLFLD